MVAAGAGKIKGLINLKANVNPDVADITTPKVVHAEVLDNGRRECGDFASLREQHCCGRITFSFSELSFVSRSSSAKRAYTTLWLPPSAKPA
jgi:hypothetical protein